MDGGTADEHGVADAKRWSSARFQVDGRHQLAGFPHNDDLSCSDVSITIDDQAALILSICFCLYYILEVLPGTCSGQVLNGKNLHYDCVIIHFGLSSITLPPPSQCRAS